MHHRVIALIRWVRHEFRVHRIMMKHPGTPLQSKILLGLALGYAISPLGLIPDVIPVIGYLDDIIIVPSLVILAVRMVPTDVVQECRSRAAETL